jgi:hypothetical protein
MNKKKFLATFKKFLVDQKLINFEIYFLAGFFFAFFFDVALVPRTIYASRAILRQYITTTRTKFLVRTYLIYNLKVQVHVTWITKILSSLRGKSPLQYLWPVLIAGFVTIIVVLYLAERPIDRPISNVQYPYVVSAKPAFIKAGESVSMKFDIVNGTHPSRERDSIYIVMPDGTKLTPDAEISDFSTISFPSDFVPNVPTQQGRYAIIFVPNNVTTSSVRLDFDVVSEPFLAELYNFTFGSGLIATFGLAGSIIAYAYQIASSRKSDLDRVSNEKAKWITDNMRSYIMLIDEDASIFKPLKKKDLASPAFTAMEARDILYGISLYYANYTEFLKKPGLYYFDDYVLESFLSELGIVILNTFKEVINDEYEELIVFKGKRLSQLAGHKKFNRYRDKTLAWLNTPGNAQKLYRNHLVHYHVLLLGINKSVLSTYSDKEKLKEDLERNFREHESYLRQGVKELCEELFNNEKYFEIYKYDKLDI